MLKRHLTVLLTLFILLIFSSHLLAQDNSKPGGIFKKRKNIGISNYYLYLNIYDNLVWYTGLIEWKTDSLIELGSNYEIKGNLIRLKYDLINVLSKTSFHTDPVVAGLDTWALSFQLQDYFSSEHCNQLYGANCKLYQDLFIQFSQDIETRYENEIKEGTRNNVINFAKSNPIMDDHLNRKSLTPLVSKWVAEDQLGIKGGLLTMTDLVRDLSDRMEYYSEMLPKQAKWQIDYSLAEFAPDDSLSSLISDTQNLLYQSSELLGKTEDIINDNRDSVLSFMDFERLEAFRSIRNERIATMATLSNERQIILQAIQDERIALESFGEQQRIEMTNDMKEISKEMMGETIGVGKELIDYIFIRMLIVSAILGVSLIVGLILYKKL